MRIPTVHITGERSIRFAFNNQLDEKTYSEVQSFVELVKKHAFVEEAVPSYHTVTIYLRINIENKEFFINDVLIKWQQRSQADQYPRLRTLRIPVCYDDEFAVHMERVIQHTGLSENEIISLHCSPVYIVYMIGFLPGFPYLGGLDGRLETPRLHTPRTVPKGAVGIGGAQTGIYPISCPGGWNLIGRTPLDIYNPHQREPFFIRAGDRLQFNRISREEYVEISEEIRAYPKRMQAFVVDN